MLLLEDLQEVATTDPTVDPALPLPCAPPEAPKAEANNVLGVFGLPIRARERDLEDEFMRYGDVEKVVIVYDQRVQRQISGFGFITMRTVEDATRCIDKLNGLSLHGRNIRVDYPATQKPHHSTPGQYSYMGVKRGGYGGDNYQRDDRQGGGRYDDRRDYGRRDDYYSGSRDSYGDNRRDRDPYDSMRVEAGVTNTTTPRTSMPATSLTTMTTEGVLVVAGTRLLLLATGVGVSPATMMLLLPVAAAPGTMTPLLPFVPTAGSRDYDASAPPPPDVPRYWDGPVSSTILSVSKVLYKKSNPLHQVRVPYLCPIKQCKMAASVFKIEIRRGNTQDAKTHKSFEYQVASRSGRCEGHVSFVQDLVL
ncbi:transformer-2 protein [Cryptococcus wingfieldii CBS 7118]|uniref:Transformer-2 protein n=1 Tax=Cryptococcus wingfieldii CBS 7118 TaxID=1295528 RepID=A0A1E3K6C7_9TREE|nr:transformer-2 protein [Cryptococcus wingfieldii CBS 7118]ODO08738.1 transformer-2 protein [Cryptococcus wingfieldii CBS 7118]